MKSPADASAALITAVATAECTSAMNEQFQALVAKHPDLARIEAKIADAVCKRKLATAALLENVRQNGW